MTDNMDALMSAASALGIDLSQYLDVDTGMYDDDAMSVDADDVDLERLSDLDKQRASLQTYLKSLPYKCESEEDMHESLRGIIGKIVVAAKAKNWLVVTNWDGVLQCWLLMRYPLPKSTRAKLVALYYEFALLPGIEPRLVRGWVDMVHRLLGSKPGIKHKLESSDLQLPWEPLWRSLHKELWPKKRIAQESSRNIINILLHLAEQCKRYFPISEISPMLDTFIPLITPDTMLFMIPVVTSFMPPFAIHLYIPALFKIWEAFNSAIIDERLLELAGELSEEHVSGKAGIAGDNGGAPYQDIGIWSEGQWLLLAGKGLGSLNVPVGSTRGASSTGGHADSTADRQSLRAKKVINRPHALAKILVYSMSVDGPVSEASATKTTTTAYVAGSKALDYLDRLMKSVESYFHPSNSGLWSTALTLFLHKIATEFGKRWKEEEQPTCRTPAERRLTKGIRHAFVKILRTPAFLSMFSKDSLGMGLAQGALRIMALLEPELVMPELLDRTYSGLEMVNETHRTTAVLSMLSGISRPLVSDALWPSGQKHLVPLLDLCIPGIDLNDPSKTVCATMFIAAAIQHIRIGDLSIHQSGMPLSGDAPGEQLMDDKDDVRLPGGTEIGETPTLSREDEIALVRDSTAGFADWIVSLLRRVLALFENLPEEGGRRNVTGGKQEEAVLKAIKSMLDIVCLHLSDQYFDLALNLVFDYASTNAKSNAVRAIGQLISCFARAQPAKTIAKFFPSCSERILDELRHGASSVRTTSSHAAVPSDTTLHWNLSILRGCLGYGGPALLKHKDALVNLMVKLVEHTKSERGYTGAGRLISRVLHTLAGVYPYNSRFVNTDQWESQEFERDHNRFWGKLMEVNDVKLEWHVPSNEEIDFVMHILDTVAGPALDKIEALVKVPEWDNVNRNDFCRYLSTLRSIWTGLPTFYKEPVKDIVSPCSYEDIEVDDLVVSSLDVQAGFTLTDQRDPRYISVGKYRTRFAHVILDAAAVLRQTKAGEDHIDAVLGVSKAIDVYLLDYAQNRNTFEALQRNHVQSRDLNRVSSQQKENSRLVFIKRAQVYHTGRVYMHALYRRRSGLDDKLLGELVELSLYPYVRVRRHAQSVLHTVCGYYVRSTRFILPLLFDALAKGNDPDRMKGALYILWNKGIASYALSDPVFQKRYLVALLECQHEEKPSIQKLVNNLAQDCLHSITEEAVNTDAYELETPRVDAALESLQQEFRAPLADGKMLAEALSKFNPRATRRHDLYNDLISSILEIAARPHTHWRYTQMASKFLYHMTRRDSPPSKELAQFFVEHAVSPQATIRTQCQRGIIKLTGFIKSRTHAQSVEELWYEEWRNPRQMRIPFADARPCFGSVNVDKPFYIDKLSTEYLAPTAFVAGYSIADVPNATLEKESSQALDVIRDHVTRNGFFVQVALFWSQEPNKNTDVNDLRVENVHFIKSLAREFGDSVLDELLATIEPLIAESDKFKQRAGAEFLCGLLRGSKHWQQPALGKLWNWVSSHLDLIHAQIKPDTLSFWEHFMTVQLRTRDPRRSQVLVNWILEQPLDFGGDSAFSVTKTLTMLDVLVECIGSRFNAVADRYVEELLKNTNTGYAEIRRSIAQVLYLINATRCQPSYDTTAQFLEACRASADPLRIREPRYLGRVQSILDDMPKWRGERIPPPRVAQSEYDKVGLTFLLWIWASAHGTQAALVFPYALAFLPEVFRMLELNDNADLQTYSSAVLHVLAAITPPQPYISAIIDGFVSAVSSSTSWRIRLHALPPLIVFFFRNLLSVTAADRQRITNTLFECLADENLEVREMASKALSSVVRCSERDSIIPMKDRFVSEVRKSKLPSRRDPGYPSAMRALHSAILGLCALIESFPYSVEPWMPSLTEELAPHATDPPPISTTIRKCASEFKKTHQDTWQTDQLLFNEDQLQSLSTMLVGTSYYA